MSTEFLFSLSEREEYEPGLSGVKQHNNIPQNLNFYSRQKILVRPLHRYLPSNEVVYEAVNDISEDVTS